MGNAARSLRNRLCEVCKATIRGSAGDLQTHVRQCLEGASLASRMAAIGLSIPKLSLEGAELMAKQKRPQPSMGRKRALG